MPYIPEDILSGVDGSPESVAEVMLWYVKRGGGATFVELMDISRGCGVDPAGDLSMSLGHDSVVLWAGVNEAFVEAVEIVRRSGETELAPTHPMTYAFDGGMLSLPIARRPPRHGYTKDHWLPALLVEKAS